MKFLSACIAVASFQFAVVRAQTPLADLNAARALWTSQRGISDYEYTIHRSCECLPSATRPYTVRVESESETDTIVSAIFAENGQGGSSVDRQDFLVKTIDGLFDDVILAAITRNAYAVTVVYDEVNGNPTSIVIDEAENIVDDTAAYYIQGEVNFIITQQVNTASRLAIQEALNVAKAVWASQELSKIEYTFDYKISSLNVASSGGITVTVKDNEVESAVFNGSEGGVVPQEAMDNLKTVEGLFDEIQNAINQEAFSIDVAYNAALGFPESISIDFEQAIVDEEFIATVTNVIQVPISGTKDPTVDSIDLNSESSESLDEDLPSSAHSPRTVLSFAFGLFAMVSFLA